MARSTWPSTPIGSPGISSERELVRITEPCARSMMLRYSPAVLRGIDS
jgi:hypothetical protein